MIKIAPSILSSDFTRLGEEIKAAEASGIDMLHIDVMDGHFVPNITIGPFIVEAIRNMTGLPLDVHLMIEKPERFISEFINAGADYVTVHLEASVHLQRTVCQIKENRAKAGVALNPATVLSGLDYILQDIDLILLMSVNPGFSGQRFIPQSLGKITAAKKIIKAQGLPILIEVDGGIKYENSKDIADAGADILVMGSGFFENSDYAALTARLRKLLDDR